jgi:hypothetical protein
MKCVHLPRLLGSVIVLLLLTAIVATAQQARPRPREFPPGTLKSLQDLPPGRLRTRIEGLPPATQQRATEWLARFHFAEADLQTLEVDSEGGIYYADHFTLAPVAADQAGAEPVTAEAAVPISPFPTNLVFHSRPGSANVLFLNFSGADITNTAWNTSLGRTLIPAVAFSTDSDFSTFSDAEQSAIKRIWQRVSEDYAPFNIDVTTERPAIFNTRTAHALITRSTDANGLANPSSSAGGIAYVDVFAGSSYPNYRPAWIYFNNLSGNESYIAEAASHEVGHNMGLSHDALTDGTSYYAGHGSGNTSWGPIMGTGYNRNVTQWSKGEYYMANNTQDDLAIIAAKISYRPDDHGNTRATATPLVITGGTNIVSSTPEEDPTNANPANKGVLAGNTDVDVFSFTTGYGPINLNVNPWIEPSGTRGGNLDVVLELYDSTGALLMTNNSPTLTTAQIQSTLNQGTYYLYIRNAGVGDPTASTPSGYTAYGSIGQYFISGYVAPSGAAAPAINLTTMANDLAWGTVTPGSGAYSPGASVQLVATPAPYYRFECWTNGIVSTNDPLSVVLTTNVSVQALFSELLTTNHPTPLWWLASNGYTGNFESAVTNRGANGMALWQSYLAGLSPTNPASQLRLSMSRTPNGAANIFNWSTVTGRVYTIWYGTNVGGPLLALPGASNLAATVRSFTNAVNPAQRSAFYRIEARRP